jgi:hypothetical protein
MAQAPTIDYFSRDFDSIRTDLLNLIPYFTPEWTDRNPNDLGVVLVELFSYLGDILHFYIDRRAQDLYLPTAFTRQSVVNLLKLIDYNVPGKQAATADILFVITDPPYDEAITIPRATRLEAPAGTGDQPVKFETLDEYIFGYTTLTADTGAPLPLDEIKVVNALDFAVGETVNLRDDEAPSGKSEDLVVRAIPDSSTIQFETNIAATYRTTDSARVSTMQATIGVQEGTTYDEVLDVSDGSAWQIFPIPRIDVIQGSISITVDEGVPEAWSEIESLGYATPGQKVYEISRNFEGYVIVRFGDGSQGKIPNLGATVSSIYRVGGGIVGNVGADKINTLLDSITSTGGPVNFSVTNPEDSSGGAEEQSIDDAKLLGPKSLRALNRAVTLEDYATLARAVVGVREANAVRRGSPLFREIDVYITPEGGYEPSETLINLVEEYLQGRSTAGETVYVQGPKNIVGVLLTATVYVLPTYDSDDIRILVEDAINDFFDVEAEGTQFGKNVNLSDLMALVDNVLGVDYVDVSQLTLDPASTLIWEVAPDDPATVDYIIGLNVSTLIDQTYTITFTSPTAYTVRDGGGVLVGTGTLGTELTTSDSALKIKLSVGIDAMANNDRAVFRTSQYVGNVEIEEFEIRRIDTLTLSFEGGA